VLKNFGLCGHRENSFCESISQV